MRFFELYEVDDGENIAMRRVSDVDLSAFAGVRFDPQRLVQPVQYRMRVGEDGFYGQYDPEFEGDFVPRSVEARLKATYDGGALMALDLATALQRHGVDNLQVFPAEVRDAETGEPLSRPYVFVNVVGRLSRATLERGSAPPAGGAAEADRPAIDLDGTRGLHLFRLAETPSTIVVSEHVAAVVRAGSFRGVRVDPVDTVDELG